MLASNSIRKIYPKTVLQSTKNQPKRTSESILEHLGPPSMRRVRVLATSWRVLACLEGILDAPWYTLARLGSVLARLGDILTRLGGVLAKVERHPCEKERQRRTRSEPSVHVNLRPKKYAQIHKQTTIGSTYIYEYLA